LPRLPLRFYRRETETVAKELLGQILVHQLDAKTFLSGRIVETEAYLGAVDPACHSYPNKRTGRTTVLFENGGLSYVYFIYGVYYCFNVVTEKAGRGEAVLVRALEPVDGIKQMRKARGVEKVEQLCSGPGKLCQAMGIGRAENGLKLNGKKVWLEKSRSVASSDIVTCPRIGIAQAEASQMLLRYYDKNSPCVSRR